MNFVRSLYEHMNVIKNGKNSIVGIWAVIISSIAVLMSLTHVYFNSYGTIPAIQFRSIHLAFVFVLVFLVFPFRKGRNKQKPSIIDITLGLTGAFTSLYMYYKYNTFANMGISATPFDLAIALIGIILIFEATRRSAGWPLIILSALFLLYARYGNIFPGSFRIVPFSTERIVYQMFYTETGIFGSVLGVSATFIFLFVLFGAFLGQNKSSEFFTDIALAAAGHKPGGPGKVAILSSALMGSISGSAVANVATTGTITIPLMKKVGYKPHFAAAVEATASSGGSIMPPVMASAAFIMSEILGVPYTTIIVAALIPAVLYYLAVWTMLDLEARKLGLLGLPKEELPKTKEVLISRGHLMIPLIILIVLLVSGRTPLYAGFWGIVSTIVISALRKDTRLSLKGYVNALVDGAVTSLSVAMTCAIVGIIVGISSMTGLGVMIAGNIVDLSGGNLMMALLLTGFACLVLGMGLPTAACYITAAVVAAPALIKLGVLPIAAHMFVLYYAILSNLTPPVALASFTAAGIAESSPNKTAMTGLKLGLTGFIIPMMFVYSPVLLMQGDYAVYQLIMVIITSVIGVIALSGAAEKYLFGNLYIFEQVLLFVVAILMIKPGLQTDLIGAALLITFGVSRLIIRKRTVTVKI